MKSFPLFRRWRLAHRACLTTSLGLLGAVLALHATDYDWASGVSGTWGSPVFWNPSTGTPSTSSDTATIAVNASMGNAYDVLLSSHTTIGGFTLTSSDASFQATSRNLNVTGNSFYSGGSIILNRSTLTTGGSFSHASGPFDMISSSINGGGTYSKSGGTLRMENSSILATGSQTSGNIVLAGSNQMRNFTNSGLIDLLGPTDISLDTTLSIGSAYHLQNGGTIKLRTGPADTHVPDIQIGGGGKLTNTGSIDIQAGVGGSRRLDVELDNQNAISSGTSLVTNASGAEHSNSGPFYINAGDYTVASMESWTNNNLLQATLGDISFGGNNSATSHLTNSSTINAGGTLTVGTTRNITNTGTLSSGGNMTVSASSSVYPVAFSNSGAISVGTGGKFTMTSPSANSQLIIQPGATFTPGDQLDLTNIQLILNQDLNLGTADFSQSGGSISGPGMLTFGAGTTAAVTSVSASSNIANNGDVTLSGFSTVSGGITNTTTATLANASRLTISNQAFTNLGNFTIEGGTSGNTEMTTPAATPQAFINEGTLLLEPSTRTRSINLNLDNRGSATFDATVNLGLNNAQHTNSGTFTINAPVTSFGQETFTITGTGTLNANSTISLDGNDAATSLFSNDGTINAADSLSIIDFENTDNNGTLNVTAGTTTVTVNSVNNPQRFTNAGDIEVSPGATFNLNTGWGTGPATFEDGATLDGGGAINLNTMSINLQGPWSIGDSTLTATSSTIGGTGPFIVPATGSLTLNASTITAPSSIDGPLTIAGNSTASGGAASTGTTNLASGARLNVNTNGFTNDGTFTMEAGNGSSYLQTGTGQTFTNGPNGTFHIAATTRDRQIQLNFDNQGMATFDAPAYLNQSGSSHANSGTLNINEDFRMQTAESFDNSGTTNGTALLLIDGNDSETSLFTNSGVISSSSSLSIIDFENANNNGAINVTAGTATVTVNSSGQFQRFTNSGDIEVSPGSTFNLNTGWSTGAATFNTGSTLDGGGNINFNTMSVSLGGQWSIGDSIFTSSSSTIGGTGPFLVPAGGTATITSSTVSAPATTDGTVTFTSTSTASGGFTNNGTATLANGARLNLNTNGFSNNGAFTMAAGTSTSYLQTSNGQTFTNAPGGTFTLAPTTRDRQINLNFDNQGLAIFDAPVYLNQSGSVHSNSGTFTVSKDFRMNTAESFHNSGAINSTALLLLDGNDSNTALFTNSGTINSSSSLSIVDFENADNNGTINVTGGTATVTVNSSGQFQRFTNSGDIEVSPGATFNLSSGWSTAAATFNPGSTLDGGGTINFNTMSVGLGGEWSIGDSTFTASSSTIGGTGPFLVPAGGTATITSSTVSASGTNDGSITFTTNSTASGGFTNNGTATIANGGRLNVNTNGFINNGAFTMEAGTSTSYLQTNSGQTFTNAPAGTFALAAATRDRQIQLNFDNQGSATFDAPAYLNQSGSVHANSGTLSINEAFRMQTAESFNNSGTIHATALLLLDGNDSDTALFTNTGTINSSSSLSIVDFENTNNNGSINVTGGTATVTVNSVSQPQRFTNAGDIEISPGATFNLSSGWSTGAATFDPGATLDGGGAINFNSMSVGLGGQWSIGDSTFTANSSSIGGTGPFLVPVDGNATITSSTVSAPATIDGDITFTATSTASGGITNNGTATLANGGRLNVNSNGFTNNGTFTMATGGSNTYLETGNDQTFTNGPAGTFVMEATTREGQVTVNFDNQGTMTLDSPSYWGNSGGIYTNSGTLTNNGVYRMFTAESVDNSGTFTSPGTVSFDGNDSATALFTNSGTITPSSSLAIIDFENVNNDGLIDIAGGSASFTLGSSNNPQFSTNTGEIRTAPGTTATFTYGRVGSRFTNAPGGRLSGSGTFNIQTLFTNNGTIAPGNSTGILTFSQSLGGTASTIYEIEVANNTGPGTGHDQLVVNGNLTLGGTLKPILLPGFTPAPSDAFVIMTATGDITGNFSSIQQPAGGGNWEVMIDEVNDQVLLTYVADNSQSYEDYQNLHFTPAQIANGDADPLVDFDGDGLVNFLEWIHGFDPTSSALPVSPLAISSDDDTIDLTYPESTLLPDGAVTVEVLGDEDLVAPFGIVPGTAYSRLSEVPLPGFPNIQMVTLRITDPTWTNNSELFFQLRFSAPSP